MDDPREFRRFALLMASAILDNQTLQSRSVRDVVSRAEELLTEIDTQEKCRTQYRFRFFEPTGLMKIYHDHGLIAKNEDDSKVPGFWQK